jgi:hypothetical protein
MYDANDFNPKLSAIDSSIYEHLFKSVTEKYLLFVATSSNLPFLSLNKQAEAAILLASIANTKISSGSGIESRKFSVDTAFNNCQLISSIGPHLNSPFLSKNCNGYAICFRYGMKTLLYWKLASLLCNSKSELSFFKFCIALALSLSTVKIASIVSNSYPKILTLVVKNALFSIEHFILASLAISTVSAIIRVAAKIRVAAILSPIF